MKFLITAFILITSYLSFGQAKSDTTIFVDGDSIVIYRGEVLKEPGIINGPLTKYFVNKIPTKVIDYIIENKIHETFIIKLLIDSTGKIRSLKLIKDEDNIVSRELIMILENSEWKPAISKEGMPINRFVFVPIRL